MAINRDAAVSTDLVRMHRLVLDQLRRALTAFAVRDGDLADLVVERDDVLDNLNIAVEERAAAAIGAAGPEEERRWLRAAVKVATNLERTGDAAAHIAKRVHLAGRDGRAPVPFAFPRLESLAVIAVDEAMRGFLERDLDMARQACEREPELDAEYVAQLRPLEAAMAADARAAGSYLDVYVVMKYLEKIGDYSLNIGEQALFVITGKRLKFSQLRTLDVFGPMAGTNEFQRFWDGISGAVVARVGGEQDTQVVFKEGSERKIHEEADRLAEWEGIAPGLTPAVFGTTSAHGRMALVREFIAGDLFADLLLSPERSVDRKVELAERLAALLASIWERTIRHERPADDHVAQIEQRLEDVFALHPALRAVADAQTGGYPSLRVMLEAARERAERVAPAYSVWVHGDLNVNNIVVSPSGLRFIDVHRSHFGDLLQDVGVLLVSLERTPNVPAAIRSHLDRVGSILEGAARSFAERQGDAGLDERLAVSRARSLITSCRVVVDEEHAVRLFRQGLATLARFGPVRVAP